MRSRLSDAGCLPKPQDNFSIATINYLAFVPVDNKILSIFKVIVFKETVKSGFLPVIDQLSIKTNKSNFRVGGK